MIEYYRKLKENEKFFDNAHEIAKEIKEKAKRIFDDCDVFIVGSFARKKHTLSSDLDILIVSSKVPEKINFAEYCSIVKSLTEDSRINIHLINREKFGEMRKYYEPMIEI
ncbi:nucleotidyltransferase domain-containing protein [Archaeoglobus fulgidus]|uniref:Nucleotidyltransferase domain protein n=1 Tax=Archaeoglobus fulgidus DSM 8774 TaxID=1344584 RepID=A0A075WFP0_ARCFL|nr:nucleotidyltransferase domain-containing protein [Archaeoglobus fulgidus]AIG98592.1 Nucleotidyltransferase domain protein [Archaeoglobus fulgidus DSM 8774]